jgi:hypothetical protein|tara:strand:- start:17856 stop:18347 length:492 start_codon:yes stop_codon:yes gene_type:complete
MFDQKNELIKDIKNLSTTSKKEILFYLQVLNLSSTSNTNGHFFLISDVPSNIIDDIYEKVKRLQSFENEMTLSFDTMNEDETLVKNLEKNDTKSFKEDMNTNLPFKCDEKILEILNNTKANNKKKPSSKYCMTLKKYIKPVMKEPLKIEEYDLNEFQVEEYIL